MNPRAHPRKIAACDGTKAMAEFTAAGWFEIKGRGWEAAVALDRDTNDFAHLIDQRVTIDGQTYRCTGVNHFGHQPPWRKGERIGLMVKARQTVLSA
jgi:hypothetical protein